MTFETEPEQPSGLHFLVDNSYLSTSGVTLCGNKLMGALVDLMGSPTSAMIVGSFSGKQPSDWQVWSTKAEAKDKAADLGLACTAVELAATWKAQVKIVLVTGEDHFYDVVLRCLANGAHVSVVGFEDAMSKRLRKLECPHFQIKYLQLHDVSFGLSNDIDRGSRHDTPSPISSASSSPSSPSLCSLGSSLWSSSLSSSPAHSLSSSLSDDGNLSDEWASTLSHDPIMEFALPRSVPLPISPPLSPPLSSASPWSPWSSTLLTPLPAPALDLPRAQTSECDPADPLETVQGPNVDTLTAHQEQAQDQANHHRHQHPHRGRFTPPGAQRCMHGYYCDSMLKCNRFHSLRHRAYWYRYGSVPQWTKFTFCPYLSCMQYSCPFLHSGEPRRCKWCGTQHEPQCGQ